MYDDESAGQRFDRIRDTVLDAAARALRARSRAWRHDINMTEREKALLSSEGEDCARIVELLKSDADSHA